MRVITRVRRFPYNRYGIVYDYFLIGSRISYVCSTFVRFRDNANTTTSYEKKRFEPGYVYTGSMLLEIFSGPRVKIFKIRRRWS